MKQCMNKFHSLPCHVRPSDSDMQKVQESLQPKLSSLLFYSADRHEAGSLIHTAGLRIIIKCIRWCNAGLGQATVPWTTNKKKKDWTISARSQASKDFEIKHRKNMMAGAMNSAGLGLEMFKQRCFTISEASFHMHDVQKHMYRGREDNRE